MPVFLHRLPTLLILTLSGLLLTGCSYIQFFYFKNNTTRNVTAIISFKEPWRDWKCNDYPPDSNSILDCRIRDMLARKLKFKALDALTISVDLPANSRTYIGNSINKPLSADSVILIEGDKREYYSFKGSYKQCNIPGLPHNKNVTYRID